MRCCGCGYCRYGCCYDRPQNDDEDYDGCLQIVGNHHKKHKIGVLLKRKWFLIYIN